MFQSYPTTHTLSGVSSHARWIGTNSFYFSFAQVAVGGAIKEEVKALMNINLGIGTKPAGSIWNRNQVLYGGVNRAEAMLAKARSLSMAASEPAAVNDAAEPKTGDV